jgi:hypothetical protein
VAISFSRVDGESFLSLTVNVGVESTTHAIFGAGDRFKITCNHNNYFVSIGHIDLDAETAQVSLERTT